MKRMKGIGLLLFANILIFATLSISFTILLEFVLPAFGIDLRGSIARQDLLWAFVIGFGGAFISLAFSKQMARAMTTCSQITKPKNQAEMVVVETVQKIANHLNIKKPEIWIYDAPDPNAFATGPSRNNSMVAVSTGLLKNLKEEEVRAVLAHEMGHVYNGDMFTTTVLAGLMNTFVYFISTWVARHVAERNFMLYFIVYIFLQVVLSFLAMIPISAFSRRREFAADRFAANTVGKDNMISALEAINRWVTQAQFEYSTKDALATMKISGPSKGVLQLFSTHPPIETRVAALKNL
jgi:heat shock protein HtpX